MPVIIASLNQSDRDFALSVRRPMLDSWNPDGLLEDVDYQGDACEDMVQAAPLHARRPSLVLRVGSRFGARRGRRAGAVLHLAALVPVCALVSRLQSALAKAQVGTRRRRCSHTRPRAVIRAKAQWHKERPLRKLSDFMQGIPIRLNKKTDDKRAFGFKGVANRFVTSE